MAKLKSVVSIETLAQKSSRLRTGWILVQIISQATFRETVVLSDDCSGGLRQ
ncbi:Uncharacterized protein YP598_3098 [Yersinia pseudotuberculosis]|nr:Uncharacterized protein YP598_3098 [Yersinia pseudotuberculosis]CNI32121.1 Uncharacterised protein [Yersinia pseudotuberculosis]